MSEDAKDNWSLEILPYLLTKQVSSFKSLLKAQLYKCHCENKYPDAIDGVTGGCKAKSTILTHNPQP